MAVILNLLREIAGLFVDDGSLALATVAILGAVGAARYADLVSSSGAAFLLCGGIFAALLENVLRSARAIEGK